MNVLLPTSLREALDMISGASIDAVSLPGGDEPVVLQVGQRGSKGRQVWS